MKLGSLDNSRSGMVLVVVLAILVLITVAVLAFFTQATANRVVEESRSHRTSATLLGRSAAEHVVGRFLDEITATNNSRVIIDSGKKIFLPRDSTKAVPSRRVVDGMEENTNAFTLVRQSVPTAEGMASSHGSGVAAKGGRKITAARWNKPRLLAGAGFASTNDLPNWIYVDINQGFTNTATTNVIGRFAYNAYEVGGLLNVNVAGYPAGLTSNQVAELKRTPVGADLELLGITPQGINDLLRFRNPDTFGSASGYLQATREAVANGFHSNILSAPGLSVTNNFLTSRQDLLRYAAVKNPALDDALPFLTHFSRSVNAPSWMPQNPTGSSTNYEGTADDEASSNRNVVNVRFPSAGTVTHYDDDGNMETYPVEAGDPIFRHRFSLAKLSWLTPEGPSALLSTSHLQFHVGGTPAAIRSVFGLQWTPTKGRWEYVGHGATASVGIKTLQEVADQYREPDFFEILKAGIFSGSLGLRSAAGTPLVGNSGVQETMDSLGDVQIMKIGANIIDCADIDNYPTIIFTELDSSGLGVEVAGVEDLPYLHGIDALVLNEMDTAAKKVNQLDLVWTPVLFNPHSSNSGITVSGPTDIRVGLDSGVLTSFRGLALDPELSATSITHSLAGQNFSVEASGFRDSPGVASMEGSPQSLALLVPYTTGNPDVLTFRMFSFGQNAPTKLPHNYASLNYQVLARTVMSNVQITLSFATPGGIRKTYASLGGYNDGDGGLDLGTLYADCNTGTPNRKSLAAAYYSMLWDPRSVRLGPSQGWNRSSATTLPNPDSDTIRYRDPFNWNDSSKTSLYWGQWPQGGKVGGFSGAAAASYTNMRDPDGVTRPADGWLSNSANLYRDLSDMSRRPMLLQRPFQTVAEMGSVFRDSPWKTLSFFDETSGDGALLDLFSIRDEPLTTAGRVNLNTAPASVIASLLSGGSAGDDVSLLQPTTAKAVAQAFLSFARNGMEPSNEMPLSSANLANFVSSSELTGSVSLSPLKTIREVIPRGLADSMQSRTWNLLIDVIAQAGRFAGSGTSETDFIVEAESRFWLAIAIDRYTGKIVDQQLEQVVE